MAVKAIVRVKGFEDKQRRNVGRYAELLRGEETSDDKIGVRPIMYRVKYTSEQLGEVSKELDYWTEAKLILRRVKVPATIEAFTMEDGWFEVKPGLARELDLIVRAGGPLAI